MCEKDLQDFADEFYLLSTPFILRSSVSIHQVKPVELTDFLQVKKNEGYCIVGVEQTANSQNLQDYQFPEKTLLLLGYDRIKHSFTISPFFPPTQSPTHNQ